MNKIHMQIHKQIQISKFFYSKASIGQTLSKNLHSEKMASYTIQEAITPEEIQACWVPLFELRPHLIESELVERVQAQQKEGYRLLYVKKSGEVAGIVGYRIMGLLFSGKTLYIDDLCTRSTARGQGIAGALLDHVIGIGQREKCDEITLDSGYTRNDAHRLYLQKRFDITSIHFGRKPYLK